MHILSSDSIAAVFRPAPPVKGVRSSRHEGFLAQSSCSVNVILFLYHLSRSLFVGHQQFVQTSVKETELKHEFARSALIAFQSKITS